MPPLVTKILCLSASIVVSCALASCGGSDATSLGKEVNPSSVGGTPGQGPLFVNNPGSPISLPDRVLTIVTAVKIYSKTRRSTLIDLTLTISNPGPRSFNIQPRDFALIVSGGDIFDHQDNSSDNFYGPIGPSSSRNGFIEFQIPSSRVTGFQLLYRPDVSGDEVVARLPIP